MRIELPSRFNGLLGLTLQEKPSKRMKSLSAIGTGLKPGVNCRAFVSNASQTACHRDALQ